MLIRIFIMVAFSRMHRPATWCSRFVIGTRGVLRCDFIFVLILAFAAGVFLTERMRKKKSAFGFSSGAIVLVAEPFVVYYRLVAAYDS